MSKIWSFTEDGFTSVVQYKAEHDTVKDGLHYKVAMATKADWLIVRARVKGDVQRLADFMAEGDLAKINFVHMPTADYSYRALITKTQYKAYVADLIDKLNYNSHFKEVSRDRAPESTGRYSAMLSVWTAMSGLQDTVPYGGSSYEYGSDDWEFGAHGGWGSYKSKGGGDPWSKGKNGTYTKYSATPRVEAIADTSEVLEFSYDHNEMALGLVAAYTCGELPEDMDQEVLNNCTDEAMRLWLHVMERSYAEASFLTDEASVLSVAEKIGVTIDFDKTASVE